MKERTCKERIATNLADRMADIRKLWSLYQRDPDARTADGSQWVEFGLCFDYVTPGTFRDQAEGYWRWLLSTGGPGDEFRFFASSPATPIYRVEYWFLDWFDGAKRVLVGSRRALLEEIWADWKDCGAVEAAFRAAIEGVAP